MSLILAPLIITHGLRSRPAIQVVTERVSHSKNEHQRKKKLTFQDHSVRKKSNEDTPEFRVRNRIELRKTAENIAVVVTH